MVGYEILGFIGGFFTTFAGLPQIIKMVKTKSVNDISFGLVGAMLVGGGFWEAYGWAIGSFPIIVWNVIAIVINSMLVLLKFKYEKKKGE